MVFKVAGAASALGKNLDQVEELARHANARTRSMGVAFTGCTLPGANEPLFSVPEGRMAIGLGIHGEPGIDEVDIPSADGLADLFAERLLAAEEIPSGVTLRGARVVPILNGLGSVKSEELFVVYRRIATILEERGIQIIDPQIGEYCTSFDMAGASLTLLWLDDRLEDLWLTPCDTPAFRTSSTPIVIGVPDLEADESIPTEVPAGSEESRATATLVVNALRAVDICMETNASELGRIDAIAGDGDHGIGMQRGAHAAADAARAAAAAGAGAGTTLQRAAAAWSDVGGGTSGAIWGVILDTIGGCLGDDRRPDATLVADALAAAAKRVHAYGKAEPGDKTMVDALEPFVHAFTAAVADGAPTQAAWRAASDRATAAATATAELLPKLGRARTHGTKSLGTPDPGAVSFALVAQAIATTLTKER